jgi:hypothetical protein
MKNYSQKLFYSVFFLALTNFTLCQEETIKSPQINSSKNKNSNELKTTEIIINSATAERVDEDLSTSEEIDFNEYAIKSSSIEPKEFIKEDHLTTLFMAFDQITVCDKKLFIINERIATIPKAEINETQINELIKKYSNDKDRLKRKVVSIEHLLKTNSINIQIPKERFDRFSDSIKQHIINDNMYSLK